MNKFLNIKYILFDAGNVLIYKVTHEDENISKLLNLNEEKYREILETIIDQQTPKEKEEFKNMNTLEKEINYFNKLHKKICLYLDIKPEKKLIDQMTNCRIHGDFAIKDDVIKSLKILSEKYKLGILSNAPPSRRHHELKIQNLDDYFENIFISKEIGLSKPDKRIYKYALDKISIPKEEILFVDDKVEYLEGAKEAGISNVVHYLKNKDVQSDKNYPTITDLEDLIELLTI